MTWSYRQRRNKRHRILMPRNLRAKYRRQVRYAARQEARQANG